jgi:hypothetical protein
MQSWIGTAGAVGIVAGVSGLAAVLLGGIAGPVHRFGLALAVGGFAVLLTAMVTAALIRVATQGKQPASSDDD